MTVQPSGRPRRARAPLHLWVVGIMLVLWNCWGVFAAVAAQARLIPHMPEEFSNYFESQPLWFMLVADLSPLSGVAGAVALLLQSRWATRLFVAQIVIVVLTNSYEVVIGTSLLLEGGPVWGSTAFLLMMLAAQAFYAHRLQRRGVLY